MITTKVLCDGHAIEIRQPIGYHVLNHRRIKPELYEILYDGRVVGRIGWTAKRATFRERFGPFELLAIRDALESLLERRVEIATLPPRPVSRADYLDPSEDFDDDDDN